MAEQQIKISLVIPVYNSEAYLDKTLSSVVNQNFPDMEIICVNDCATDRSGDIIEKYVQKDSRVRHIRHEQNMGTGIARRTGIQASSGTFIMFLDGDDYLNDGAFKDLYEEAIKAQTDILQFGTTVIPVGVKNTEKLEHLKKMLAPYDGVLYDCEPGELMNHCFIDHWFGFTLWNKMFRGDVVRRAVRYYGEDRFDMAQDMYLFFLIVFFSKSYASVPTTYMNYQFGTGITGDKPWTETRLLKAVKIGRMTQNMEAFLMQMDCYEKCIGSVEQVKASHLSMVVKHWIENCLFDTKVVLSSIFENYKKEDVLAELLHWYYRSNQSVKELIVTQSAAMSCVQRSQGRIKTVGTYYFHMNCGGVQRVLALLAEKWTVQGYRVVVFTDTEPDPGDYELPEGVIRVVIPKAENHERKGQKTRILQWQELLKQYDVDCMVYHAWTDPDMLTALFAIKSFGIPVVMYTHGLFAHAVDRLSAEWAMRSVFISKIYAGFADAVITITKTDHAWWSMLHPNVYHTVNPIPFRIEDIQPVQPEKKDLIYLGRLSPEKRIEDMVEILKIVRDAGHPTNLHLVGSWASDSYSASIQDKIETLGLTDSVIQHGFHSDVIPFYQKGGISLLTTRSEGFCLTLVESMAFGLPVVLYDLPNLDVVQKGMGISIVPQGEIQRAADAVINLLEDEQAFVRMSREANESMRDFYSVDLGVFWNQVFADLSNGQLSNEIPDYRQIKNAVQIMVDFYIRGVECREEQKKTQLSVRQSEITKLKKQLEAIKQKKQIHPQDMDEVVAWQFRQGELGFRYLVHYTLNWLRYKLKGPEKQNISSKVREKDPAYIVERRSYEGELGMRHILKYCSGWLKYKLFGAGKVSESMVSDAKEDPADSLVQRTRSGELGMRYIMKYARNWLVYKLFGSEKNGH